MKCLVCVDQEWFCKDCFENTVKMWKSLAGELASSLDAGTTWVKNSEWLTGVKRLLKRTREAGL